MPKPGLREEQGREVLPNFPARRLPLTAEAGAGAMLCGHESHCLRHRAVAKGWRVDLGRWWRKEHTVMVEQIVKDHMHLQSLLGPEV